MNYKNIVNIKNQSMEMEEDSAEALTFSSQPTPTETAATPVKGTKKKEKKVLKLYLFASLARPGSSSLLPTATRSPVFGSGMTTRAMARAAAAAAAGLEEAKEEETMEVDQSEIDLKMLAVSEGYKSLPTSTASFPSSKALTKQTPQSSIDHCTLATGARRNPKINQIQHGFALGVQKKQPSKIVKAVVPTATAVPRTRTSRMPQKAATISLSSAPIRAETIKPFIKEKPVRDSNSTSSSRVKQPDSRIKKGQESPLLIADVAAIERTIKGGRIIGEDVDDDLPSKDVDSPVASRTRNAKRKRAEQRELIAEGTQAKKRSHIDEQEKRAQPACNGDTTRRGRRLSPTRRCSRRNLLPTSATMPRSTVPSHEEYLQQVIDHLSTRGAYSTTVVSMMNGGRAEPSRVRDEDEEETSRGQPRPGHLPTQPNRAQPSEQERLAEETEAERRAAAAAGRRSPAAQQQQQQQRGRSLIGRAIDAVNPLPMLYRGLRDASAMLGFAGRATTRPSVMAPPASPPIDSPPRMRLSATEHFRLDLQRSNEAFEQAVQRLQQREAARAREEEEEEEETTSQSTRSSAASQRTSSGSTSYVSATSRGNLGDDEEEQNGNFDDSMMGGGGEDEDVEVEEEVVVVGCQNCPHLQRRLAEEIERREAVERENEAIKQSYRTKEHEIELLRQQVAALLATAAAAPAAPQLPPPPPPPAAAAAQPGGAPARLTRVQRLADLKKKRAIVKKRIGKLGKGVHTKIAYSKLDRSAKSAMMSSRSTSYRFKNSVEAVKIALSSDATSRWMKADVGRAEWTLGLARTFTQQVKAAEKAQLEMLTDASIAISGLAGRAKQSCKPEWRVAAAAIKSAAARIRAFEGAIMHGF